METLVAQLTATAKALGIALDSEAMLEALEVAIMSFEDGRGLEASFDFGRSVLVASSTSGRSVRALTAV